MTSTLFLAMNLENKKHTRQRAHTPHIVSRTQRKQLAACDRTSEQPNTTQTAVASNGVKLRSKQHHALHAKEQIPSELDT